MTEFDNTQAIHEGWSIFECDGSDNGHWQLMKLDCTNQFMTDIDAWRHVVECADLGSVYHKQALSFLTAHNPTEYFCIMDTVRKRAIA